MTGYRSAVPRTASGERRPGPTDGTAGGWSSETTRNRKLERAQARNFDWSDQDPEQDQEEQQAELSELEKEKRADHDDLAAELARSRPDPASSETDTARQLDQIRHAFRHHAADIQPPPQAAALRADQGSGHQDEAPGGRSRGSPGATGRQQYMPWLLIAGIAVGTVATVLGAIVVVRRVRGAPGKVVTQQWIPHHALRMSTGSADIQPGGGRAGDQAAGAPIRIKAKGLLERRCSNSSLTIQLQQTEEDGEPIVVTSPATHSEAAEYLASAGNRLSRRELRQTEENVAALQAEFWDIPLNFPDKCDVVGASTKNRYKTVLPNEHTRVTLPGVNEDPLSSYINANWIRGYDNEERAYIATQGPLAHTLEDFWLMVLSRRAPAVVMITKLRENGRIKCAGYLPETRQKATFGKIEVTVKRILPRNGYTLRHVTVKRGKEQLQLQHFWFTAWPDHRTPDDSQQLLQMAAEVESARRDSEGNPTTAEQYIFIHRALRDFEASLPALEGSARSTN
ncbi:Receptor-type tyrosine-protein phosphatase R [Amphibalanus amphitrite]|uniref:protein-tyrosine-phosphatase n=1 Tax=Amphibalanus amphitrite TaxID=1232801 RepID=A0A6A4WD19_AMPAM|nr:Receptor-type tyrosine-protein phosphatase R [Amphibalanus amphitrite]